MKASGHRAAAEVGLRVDVCTYQGLREGVPRLLDLFVELGVRATLVVAMGPDCSGRAVFRLWRKPGFASKLLRTGALRLYGVRTALYGTLLPAPRIAERASAVLGRIRAEGHEVGIHSWDHVRWQDHLDETPVESVRRDYQLAVEAFCRRFGDQPQCSAAPAWLASDVSLAVAEEFDFDYCADTRGRGPFRPLVAGRVLDLPQVPITLPTLDERLGLNGTSAEGFYNALEKEIVESPCPVHVIHAEVEGGPYLAAFEVFARRLLGRGGRFLSLREVLARVPRPLPVCTVLRGRVSGRAGAVSLQGPEQA